MFKRIISFLISVIMLLTVFNTLRVSANAALGIRGTEYGTLQDTSNSSNGTIKWAYTYDMSTGIANLTLEGSGYMPNDTEESWLTIRQQTGCLLTKVTIGDGIKSIMNNAFIYEEKLAEVKLPDSLEIIGEGAFAYSGVKTLDIPAKVSFLSGRMFAKSKISSFTFNRGSNYFSVYNGDIYSKDMKTFITAAPGKFKENSPAYKFHNSTNIIAEDAFYLSPVTSAVIHSNIKEIRNMAFSGSSLRNIYIDSGVQKIYDSAFLECKNLTEIALPDTVNYLGYYSIGYIYKLDFETMEAILDDAGVSHGKLTESNCQAYLSKVDYRVEDFLYCAPSNATIYASSGSLGQKYADNNSLKFFAAEANFSRVHNVKQDANGILIQWVPSSNATGYTVLRKDIFEQWETIATVSGKNTISYVDKNPHDDFLNEYTVIAFNDKGTAYYDKVGLSCTYIKAPVLSNLTVHNNCINFSWSIVNNAVEYTVFRKTQGDTSWRPLATVGSNILSYSDKSVQYGKTYSYTVAAANENGYGKYNEVGLSGTFLGSTRIAVYNVSAGLAIRWKHSGIPDNFMVYRKNEAGAWVLIYTATGKESVYVDKAVVKGTKYTYKVEPVIKGKTNDASTATGSYVSLDSPVNFTVLNRVSGIAVNWKKCAGSTGYYVYRKLPTDKYWRRIAVINSADTVSYLDTNVNSGSTYIYTIKSFNGIYMSDYRKAGRRTIFTKTPKANNVKSTKDGMAVKYTQSPNADGYYIYRRTAKTTWQRVGVVKNGKTLVYFDKSAKKGTTYLYTVRAYKNGVRSSYYSYGYWVKDIY